MAKAPGYLKYFQILSVDVAIGCVVGALFVANYLSVTIPQLVILVLFLTVWLIYTMDHLLDVQTNNKEPMSARHLFHWRHSTMLWGVWSLVLIATISLSFKLPSSIILNGSILAVSVFVYFISIRLMEGQKIYHKEIMGALVYACGVFLGAVTLTDSSLSWDVGILFFEFVLLAFLNLTLFSLLDKETDEAEGFQSLVISIGERRVIVLFWITGAILLLITVCQLMFFPIHHKHVISQIVVLIMTFVTILLIYRRALFKRHATYRTVGDAVFIIPVFTLFLWA